MTDGAATIPEGLKFTEDHEWVKIEGDLARVGITQFAQDQLGDVVYVELPASGDALTAGEAFGVIESVKAASDLLSPLTGSVAEANERLLDEPELVNDDPYGDGWMMTVEPSDSAQLEALMDAAAYARLLQEAD
jgi:glycine cleavage system H protein